MRHDDIDDGEVFWMVWNPRGNAPTVRHCSEYRAISEAERLARNCPGQEFFVLEAKCSRQVAEPMIRRTLEHGIPF